MYDTSSVTSANVWCVLCQIMVAPLASARINDKVLIVDGRIVSDSELLAFLEYEANVSGRAVEQVYRDEMAARAELQRITPPLQVLLERGRLGGAPPYMDENGLTAFGA